MSRKAPVAMTEAQATVMILELGVVAACAVLAISGTLRGLFSVTKTAKQVKGVAEEAVRRI